MADKKLRTTRDVHMEMCEAAQKIGLLQYQMDMEIPKELNKLMNLMNNLQIEGDKIIKAEDKARAIAKENGTTIDLPPLENEETSTETPVAEGEPTNTVN